jgi:toxin ParE1/3/4
LIRPVVFDSQASRDFAEIFAWIADHSSLNVADRYTARLRAFCERLALFPERGMRRDDLAAGVRLLGFERRVTVAFVVAPDAVAVLRLLYGGRDIEVAFGGVDHDD